MNIIRTITRTLAAAIILTAACGCDKNRHKEEEPENTDRRVLLLYECGFNDISSYMRKNVTDLESGMIPKKSEDVLLVYSKFARSNSDRTPVTSFLRRIYKTSKGETVSDTLKMFRSDAIAASPSTVREVLSFVKENFPAKGYGMVFSSHGSGWLPVGYYFNPARFELEHEDEAAPAGLKAQSLSVPRLPVPEGDLASTDPYYGKVRSIGQDFVKGEYYGIEMTISEFAEAIPYHLDYLLFDMCFTGGVEVAYGLKGKADYLGLSPAEVIGDGMFDYTKLTSFLLNRSVPDLEGLFKDSFDLYDKQSGAYRSATLNLVRTDGLDKLAEVCSRLFEEYSDALSNAPTDLIQGYFRSGRHYFYDLQDTFEKCGVSQDDLKSLDDALEQCVVYKNATPKFLNTFNITDYSGFSVYLQQAGSRILDRYYKEEPWNKATGMIR